MASVSQAIPDKEVLLVEYPGFVRHPDAAIQTLGGLDAIKATSNGSSPVLSLHFRPGDPLSHPLLGYKQSTSGLLLRISRKARQAGAATDAEEELKAEVVAHVKSAVRFPGMADFQYVSCDPRPLQEQVSHQEGPPGLEPEPMLFPPALFTKQDLPMDYAFRSFYSADPDYMKTGANVGRGVGRLAAHVINFQAVNVLQPLSDSVTEEAGLYRDRKLILRDFSALLAERPIWSSAALKQRVTGFTAVESDIMLPRVAYMFRNGPWKGLWVRRGYDPRSDPTSHEYQALHYTGVERSSGGAAGDPAGPSYNDVTSFAALPTGECTLQLCDLADDYIQGVLQKPAQLNSCSIKSGWFSAEVWHELRERLKARFAALQHAAASSKGLAGSSDANLTAPTRAADEPGAESGQLGDAARSTTDGAHPQPSEGAPQQDSSPSAGAGQSAGAPEQSANKAGSAHGRGPANSTAAQPQEAADVSMADDVSAAADGAAQHAAHDILPAVYLQSVLDSWQEEGPPPPAPSAAGLLAASGVDQGDFEIYEGSEEDEEAGSLTEIEPAFDEDGQTNDEAEDSEEPGDDGQVPIDGESGEEAFGKEGTEGEEEDSDKAEEESEDEESRMHDEDMEEAYNENDDMG